MSKIELFQGDCLEIMKNIPDKSIDMILCDLPYGTTACKWDSIIPFEELWNQYNRIIKEDGAIALFGSEPFSSYLRMSNIKEWRYDWIWNKIKPSNFQQMNRQPGKVYEIISIFSKTPAVFMKNKDSMRYYPQKIKREKVKKVNKTFYGSKNSTLHTNHSIVDLGAKEYEYKMPINILEYSNANIKGRLHPTQKPVELLEYLIKTYTNEGENVLDNCMGSGSTGVACKNLNRDFIGIELDENYFNIAKERIEGQ